MPVRFGVPDLGSRLLLLLRRGPWLARNQLWAEKDLDAKSEDFRTEANHD